MKITNAIINLSLLASLASCATIVHGPNQKICISSNPANANVWVDNMYVATTPCIVQMARKDDHVVTIQLDGFLQYQAVFTRNVSGWVFGNIIFGGIIGLAVDGITGSIFRLTPEQVHAEMMANNVTYSSKAGDSCIMVVMKPNPEWEKVGNLVAAE